MKYGVSIAKKIAKKAVIRNRVKRLMREALRAEFKDYVNNNSFCPFKTIILIWRKAPKMASQIFLNDVVGELKQILEDAKKYYHA